MKRVLYTKFSRERSEPFEIATAIEEEDGVRSVTKTALTPEAAAHVMRMHRNYSILAKLYHYPELTVCPCEAVDDRTVRFPYIQGKSLDLLLTEHIEQGDFESVKRDVQLLRDILYSAEGLCSFEASDEFASVFGEMELPTGLKGSSPSNLDMLFANILVGDKLYLVDYEWVFDFVIPVTFVFARSLMLHAMLQTLEEKQLEELYAIGGVRPEDIPVYYEMELRFQKYVTGEEERNVLSRLYPLMNRNSFFLRHWNTDHLYYDVKLYGIPMDHPNERKELFSKRYILGEVEDTVRIPDTTRYRKFLLQPMDTECIITMRRLEGKTGEQVKPVPVTSSNADLCYEAKEYRFRQAPEFWLENEEFQEISFAFMVWHRNNALIFEDIRLREENEKLHRELKLSAGWYLALKKLYHRIKG